MQGYDFKLLVDKLKARGLDIAEDGAKSMVSDVLDFLIESAQKSPTPFDDILIVVLGHAKAPILKELDKIDGQVG